MTAPNTDAVERLVGKLLDLSDYFEPNDLTAATLIRQAAAALPALLDRVEAVEAGLRQINSFIADYKAPWGSWKTEWWEGEVSDNAAFSDMNALSHVANIARDVLGQADRGAVG